MAPYQINLEDALLHGMFQQDGGVAAYSNRCSTKSSKLRWPNNCRRYPMSEPKTVRAVATAHIRTPSPLPWGV